MSADEVEPGQKGVERLRRKNDPVARFLQSKRPAAEDMQRWLSYRTEATLGYNLALASDADEAVLARLRAEAEHAESVLGEHMPCVMAALRNGS